MGGLVQGLERAAELEDIAIAVFPIVEKGKVAANGIEVCQRDVLRVRIALYIGMRVLGARPSGEKSGAGLGRPTAPRRRQIGRAQRIDRRSQGPGLRARINRPDARIRRMGRAGGR